MKFGWPTCSMRRRTSKPLDRTRLILELLEARDCPAAPQLTMSAVVLSGQTVQVTGTVTDSDPASVSIALGGVLSGTAQAGADGNFAFTGQVSSLGTIYGQATDAEQLTSDVVDTVLSASAPSLTLNATYHEDGTVTLAGQVTDDSPGNLTVTFAGPVNAQITTADDGSFSYTTGAWGPGDQQAVVTDLWGQSSNTADVTLNAFAPSAISLSAANNPDGSVTLAGQVTADLPAGLIVTLWGAVNAQVTTASDGSFSYTTTGWDLGDVNAYATNGWGQSTPSTQVALSAAAPTLTLNTAFNPDGTVTLTGQVSSPLPANLPVVITGVVNGEVSTAADGSFSYTTTAASFGDVDATTTDTWGQASDPVHVNVRADAPAVTLNADYNADGSVTLSGQVDSVAPANLTVTLTGGVNAQVTTAEDGTFSLTTTAYMFGNVQATTTDPWGQQSAPAQATLTLAAPVISLNPPVYGPNGSVTLSGQVTANDPGNLTVTLTGEVNTQVTTNPDGTFSLTTTSWGLGDVQASTTDTWGQGSNTAHVTLTNTAPVITGFTAYEQPDNMWTFEGQVTDEWAPGLNVRLGGLPSLQGVIVQVGSDGWFCTTVQLQPGESGIASAIVTDWWGVDSQEQYAVVNPCNLAEVLTHN